MRKPPLFFGWAVTLFCAASSQAAVFQVTTAAELHGALATARDNNEPDIIRVAQGTYVGNFVYGPVAGETFDLALEGGWSADFLTRDLDPANTILDGDRAGGVLFINKPPTSASGSVTVEGFTIRNGFTTFDGAGISLRSFPPGTVTLRRNIIEGNESTDTGGGFWVSNDDSTTQTGGPIHIEDNIIRGNAAASGTDGNGGGGRIYALGALLFSNNLVYGNSAGGNPTFYGAGGGVFVSVIGGSVRITNNTVTGNTAYTNGGGMVVRSFGLAGFPAQEVQLFNNIIWGNTATTADGSDLYAEIATTQGNTLDIAHNAFHDLFIPPARLAPTLSGNIDQDPRFLNVTDPDPVSWDLRLQPDSPCVDAGDNAAPGLPATDLPGNARIIDGDGDGNAAVDMGAYERDVVFRIYRVTSASDDDCSESDCDLQSALNAAARDNTNSSIRVAQGTYAGNFTYTGTGAEDYALILEGGWSGDFSTRTIDPTSTVLDGGGTGRVLSVDNRPNAAFGDVTIEGFTLRHGISVGVAGGGLLVAAFPPGTITINRNILEENQSDYSAGGLIAINREPGTPHGGPMVVSNNIVRNNLCGTGSAASGGGAYLYNTDTLSLFNNLVYGNQARGSQVLEGLAGGMVVVTYAGDTRIVNNTVIGNRAHTRGGGLYVLEAGDAWDVSSVRADNNIIRSNKAGAGSSDDDILNKLSAALPALGNTLTIANSNFAVLTNDAGAVAPALTANIDADPMFGNMAGPDPILWDLRPRYGSPCVDTGDNSAPGMPTTDFLGNGRVLDGNGDGTTVADMGAYELLVGMNPSDGTIGTVVSLHLPLGGFGTAKPKVYLHVTNPVTARTKRLSFRLVSWSNGMIQALWKKKVAAGDYPLVVQPAGKGIAPMPMGMFRIQVPAITGFMPTDRSGAVGDEITINGRFFGSGKPKVLLTYLDGSGKKKRCKVRTSSMDPTTGVSTVVFVVPKLPPKRYGIEMANGIGGTGPHYDFEILP